VNVETNGYAVIPRAHRVLDCTDLLCPLPVIHTSRAIREIEVGQILHLIATDPGAPMDMRAWSRMTGNTLLDAHEQDGVYHFYFERMK